MNEHDFLTRTAKHEPFLHSSFMKLPARGALFSHTQSATLLWQAARSAGLTGSLRVQPLAHALCNPADWTRLAISDEIVTDVQGVAYGLFPYTKIKLNLKIHYSADT